MSTRPSEPPTVHPEIWPVARAPAPDPAVEARVDALLARMTLEEKVGQVIQAELQSVTPEDVRAYNLGSVLNGGGSAPGGDVRAAPEAWLALADAFWEASTDTSDGGVGVPAIWGTDAVHGHNAAFGATIFPHNIGLGAAGDPALVRRIGEVVAREASATGHDWTFSPTVAVPRDDRWGRTYEGFSEDPALVAALAGPYVEGLQGAIGADQLGDGHVVATAKHFLGDGGTTGGRDQGDTEVSEEELRDIHGAGYVAAIEAGVQTVMASYSTWWGRKLHGHDELLTDVLKGRMGFDGFVVGDWNGHGQVAGCASDDCPAALNAGIDMFMVPQDWRSLYDNTLEQARTGVIAPERLDDAVRRILRVKARAGVLHAPRPSERPLAGRAELLGAPSHRDLAREAVRRSLVLLKNNDRLLPLSPRQRVLVAGPAAHDLARQTGGWTLTWQGDTNTNEDFPGGTSIFEGIRTAVEAAGGRAVLSVDGTYVERPDVAVVVYGETPYAEFQGDRSTLAFSPGDRSHIALLERLRADGVPVVSVFISGRPLWANPEINASDAFVAAWLPGTEGAGVADVLFTAADGSTAYDFTGTLSFSWPRTAAQSPLNAGDPDYDPLFPLGYGLTYGDDGDVPRLSEDPGVDLAAADARTVYLAAGAPVRPWRLTLAEGPGGGVAVGEDEEETRTANGWLSAARDGGGEGAVALAWSGAGPAVAALSAFQAVDLSREANGAMALVARARLDSPPPGGMTMTMAGPGGRGSVEVGGQLAAAAAGEWIELRVRLSCFAAHGADVASINGPLSLTTSDAVRLALAEVRLAEGLASDACPQ